MDNRKSDIIKIDVDAVLRQRIPGLRKILPGCAVRGIERLICQDDMNQLLESNHGKRDADFCRGVLEELNVSLKVDGILPDPSHKRVVIVSNHPLGGLDSIAMIDWLCRYFRGNIHFLVNDLLMAIEPLRGVFLPINKHGRQSRQALNDIDNAMAGDNPIVIFPAGLVSRRGKGGVISDLEWKKMFVTKAIQHKRDIIPAYFGGNNSAFFYNFAKWRKRLGVKFNIEMILLPREVFKCRNRQFTLSFGEMIEWESLKKDRDPGHAAQKIKETVYALAPKTEKYI